MSYRRVSTALVAMAAATILGCAPSQPPQSDEEQPLGAPVFGYPTGDRTTYPAGGGGWWVSQPLGHWSTIDPFIGNHLAEDIRNTTSDTTTFQPVYSIGDGTVLYAGPNSSTYVNVVLIRHDLPGHDPVCSFYGHIDALRVSTGQHVARGQQIARIMDWAANIPGGAKNSHLHYTIVPWDLCQASAATNGALVCGYDNGSDDAYHRNMTIDDEPDTYQARNDVCHDESYGPFIAPSKFIRAHALGAAGGDPQRIALARNADGRLEVIYADGDGALYHRYQTPSGAWSPRDALGGRARNVAVAANADGRLEVVYVGTNGALYHNWQLAPNSGWHGEAPLGGTAKRVVLAANADGHLEIVYVGTNDRLYHNWQTSPNGAWNGERALDGFAKELSLAQNLDGRLELVYIGTNDRLYHNWQDRPNGVWLGQADLGGAAQQIALGENADGRLELLYVGTNRRIYHNWQKSPGGGWHGEAELGGAAKRIALAVDEDGRLELIYVGTNDALYHNWQSAPSSGWAGEAALGGRANQIAVERNADGRLELVYIGTNGALYHNWQRAPNGGWFGERPL